MDARQKHSGMTADESSLLVTQYSLSHAPRNTNHVLFVSQRLLQIRDQIINVLHADRQAHQKFSVIPACFRRESIVPICVTCSALKWMPDKSIRA
jgi:hypothetical protein